MIKPVTINRDSINTTQETDALFNTHQKVQQALDFRIHQRKPKQLSFRRRKIYARSAR